ncbi:unnamed protein product, partial [Staurois parvus]
INGRTVAVQGQVAVLKTDSPPPACARSLGHSGTPIVVRDLCVRSRSCDH